MGEDIAAVDVEVVSGFDAAFLHMETPSTHWHVLGVLVFDDAGGAGPFDAEMLRRVLAERIDQVEVLRRRVVDAAPGRPVWTHTDVDLDSHVVSVSLPAGSGLAELAALAGEIASRPLRRDRPLWEIAVVDGLASGRRAVVAKVHHALVDGVAAVGVLGAVLDSRPWTPPPRPGDHREPAASVPGRREQLATAARAVVDQPAAVARSLTRVARSAWHVLGRVRERQPPPTLPLTAPRVCLSRAITPARSAAFATVEAGAIVQVKDAFGVTFNDVAVAIAAGAIRRWLADAGELPERPLVAAIPTSVRRGAGRAGNEVSSLFGAVPTHLDDPAERVRFVAREMPDAKAFHEDLGRDTLGSLAQAAPWNLAALLFRAYSDLGLASRLPPAVNLVLTSVPGPSTPLYCGGARLDSVFPLGPILDGAALNVTVVSYVDRVCIGILTCPDVCPPVQNLADAMGEAVDELVTAARLHRESAQQDADKEKAMDVQERNRRALEAVQERRDEYYEAVLAFERAMATAAGDDAAAWASAAVAATRAMQQVLDSHIRDTEAPEGFFAEIIEHAPNLLHAASRLRDEHGPLAEGIAHLISTLQTVQDDDGVEAARQEALDLIRALLVHRHRGAELVYDAYNVDVAPGD